MPWLPQCIELLRAGVIPRQIHESENKKAADCEQVEKYSVTFLVYFLTMASQTGCEIMNTEVAGSILTAFLVYQVKKKKDYLTFKNLQNSTHLKTIRAIRIIASHSNTEKI